jgi:hypothetical protein
MPMPMSDPGSDPLDEVKPRRHDPLPRCPSCKSESPIIEGTYRPGAMWHPAHPYGPCQVTDEGVPCGCSAGALGSPL